MVSKFSESIKARMNPASARSSVQGKGVSSIRRTFSRLLTGVRARWEESVGVFQHLLAAEREAALAPPFSSEQQMISGVRLCGFIIGKYPEQSYPVFEGTNDYIRGNHDCLVPWKEDPSRDCDFQLRVVDDELRLIRLPEGIPANLHTNESFNVGKETFVVKLLPETLRSEVDPQAISNLGKLK